MLQESMNKSTPLRRTEIAKVLRRHEGASSEIARSLGIRPQNVYKWAKGQTVSARIAEAAQTKALELLATEATIK